MGIVRRTLLTALSVTALGLAASAASAQDLTILSGGAVTPKARDPEQARRFLAYLQTPESRQAFAKRGYMAGP